jgi:hypothetical protein
MQDIDHIQNCFESLGLLSDLLDEDKRFKITELILQKCLCSDNSAQISGINDVKHDAHGKTDWDNFLNSALDIIAKCNTDRLLILINPLFQKYLQAISQVLSNPNNHLYKVAMKDSRTLLKIYDCISPKLINDLFTKQFLETNLQLLFSLLHSAAISDILCEKLALQIMLMFKSFSVWLKGKLEQGDQSALAFYNQLTDLILSIIFTSQLDSRFKDSASDCIFGVNEIVRFSEILGISGIRNLLRSIHIEAPKLSATSASLLQRMLTRCLFSKPDAMKEYLLPLNSSIFQSNLTKEQLLYILNAYKASLIVVKEEPTTIKRTFMENLKEVIPRLVQLMNTNDDGIIILLVDIYTLILNCNLSKVTSDDMRQVFETIQMKLEFTDAKRSELVVRFLDMLIVIVEDNSSRLFDTLFDVIMSYLIMEMYPKIVSCTVKKEESYNLDDYYKVLYFIAVDISEQMENVSSIACCANGRCS